MTSTTLSPVTASALVALGGAIGALARFQLGRIVAHIAGPGAAFPWATFAVNVIGSFAMGALFGWLARNGGAGEALRLALGVGLLGGFTTFSAFSLEMFALIERGQAALALLYAGGSVVAGLAALWLGLVFVRGAA